jgi:hypothetical protein
MLGKARNAGLVLLGLMAAAALSIAVYYLSSQGSNTTVLSDTTQITVLGVSRGGESFPTESRWLTLARRVLPARWQHWLPSPSSGFASGGPNSLTIWLQVQSPNTTNTPGTAIAPPWYDCFCMGEDGFKFPTETHTPSGAIALHPTMAHFYFSGNSTNPPQRQRVYGLRCDTLPRRQAKFTLRFYDITAALLGSLKVRNPFPRAFPQWTPEPLPVTHSNGPLTATLVSVTNLANGNLAVQLDATNSSPHWGVPGLEVHAAGELRREWSDATGNLGTPLPADEPAWKLELWYQENSRVGSPGAVADPLDATLGKLLLRVQVPGPGALIMTNSFAGPDWQVRIGLAAGPGLLVQTNNTNFVLYPLSTLKPVLAGGDRPKRTLLGISTSDPFIVIDRNPPWLSVRAIVWAGSQQLAALDRDRANPLQELPGPRVLDFRLPPGTNTVTLEINVTPLRRLEFLVDPKQVR